MVMDFFLFGNYFVIVFMFDGMVVVLVSFIRV